MFLNNHEGENWLFMMGTAVKWESLGVSGTPELSLSDHFNEAKFTYLAFWWAFNTNNELLNL